FHRYLSSDVCSSKLISEVSVFSLQDNYQAPVVPVEGMTFSFYGLTDFEIEYWTGSAWAIVPGGSITGNTAVWRRVTFAPITTDQIGRASCRERVWWS